MDEELEKAIQILVRSLDNIAQNMNDDYIQANAKFRSEAGMVAKVIRKSSGHCCKWCESIAGTYIYPDVPQDVYRRHDNCDCTVEYDSGDGTKTTIHSGTEGQRRYVKNGYGGYEKTKEYRVEQAKKMAESEDARKKAAREKRIATWEEKKGNNGLKIEKNTENNLYFDDILEEYTSKAGNKKYEVEKALKIIKDGIEYSVNGTNVILDPSTREEEIAEILNRTLGKNVKIMPRFAGELRNISSSDYQIEGDDWDLKEIKNKGKDAVRDAIKRHKKQADNFVIDITQSKHDPEQLKWQIENVFKAYNTQFVKKLIIVKDSEIIRIMKRK